MSDITDHRKAQEHLAASDVDADPKLLMKAAIYASLSSARALRELDGTTHRVNRLLADSVDELARDLRRLLRPAFIDAGAGQLVNASQITALVDVTNESDEDNATRTEIWLSDGNCVYSREGQTELHMRVRAGE